MSKVMLRKIMLGALCAIFAACMALCCVFAMAPASNVAAEGSGEGSTSGAEDELIVYEGSTFYDWASMKAYIESLHAGDEETIIVGADMSANSEITVPNGVSLTLTSSTNDEADRKTILRASGYKGILIRVGDLADGGELSVMILRNIVFDGNGNTNGGFVNDSLIRYSDNSYGEMYDGVYIQNNYLVANSRSNPWETEQAGAGIYLDATQNYAAEFKMYGGYNGGHRTRGGRNHGGAFAVDRYITQGNVNIENKAAVLTINGGSVSDNYAETGNGAGISLTGKLIINGGLFSNNWAGNDTVIYCNNIAEFTINGGEFCYNGAGATAISAIYGVAEINGGKFYGNYANNVDLLFHLSAWKRIGCTESRLTINYAEFYDNYATGQSTTFGLIDVGQDSYLTIEDCLIYNNDCGYGQLFFLWDWANEVGQTRVFELNGGRIYNNTARYGLINSSNSRNGSQIYINGGEIYDNTVYGNGGIIYNQNGKIVITGGEIYNNKAQSGRETSDSNGGAIYASGGSTEVSGGEFIGNTAGANGGAVYIANGTFTMTGGTFEGNSAAGMGGAAYVTGGTFTMTGGEFIGNVAASYPGFYVNGDINLGGDVRLEGNMTSEGVEQNVYLATEDAKVNIVSPIAEAYIGITKLNNSGVVAKGSGYTLQDYDALALYCDGGGDYTFTVNKDLNQIVMGARSAHEHVYSDYRVDATCDEQGYLMRVCPGCHHIATWEEFTDPDDPAYVSPDSPVYEDYGGADGGITVGGEKVALAVIAPQGHAYTWVNDGTDPHAAYGGYFTCTHGWTDVVTQEEESCGSRLYLKAEGIEEGGYAYTGKAQTPQVWLSLYSLDEEGNEIFYRSITENMFTAEYADNTAAGEARITLRFVTANAVFNRQYTLTVPTGENMGESLGTVSLTDSLSSADARPVATFTINAIPAEVTVEQPAIPQDGREENAWYTDDADYGYFFENLRKTATADSGLMGEIAGRWEWNIGTAEEPVWSETPPRLAAGTNVLQWRFTPTDESITAVTGEFTVDGVEEYLPVRLNANIASVSPVTDTDGWETFKANWTFSVTYNKGNTVTLGDKSAVTAVLVGDDGTEYADLVVGTYHVKFSYTERGETVTVTPAVSVTVIADELTGLEVVLDGAPVYDTAALEDLRAHLTVTGKHTVGEDTEVTGYTLTCVSAGGWKNEPGEYTVRVTYGQLSQEVQVTVLANRAERLEVTFGQEKPVYTSTEKSDIADYGTLAVTVFYSDGSEKALSYDASGMSGYTIEEGTFADGDTVAIYYKETDKAGSVASVSAQVRAVVDAVRATHISYEVKEGAHIFTSDTTPSAIKDKLTVTLHYNDGTSESVEHFTVESVSLSSGGELTFVVAAEKDGETFRTEGTVTPEEVAPESLEVALQAGAGTIYVTEDAESIKAYLTVKVLYNNGTEKELAPSEYAAAISGGELQPGSNTLVITYEGEGASLSRTFAVDAEAVYFDRIEVEVKAEYGSGTQIRDGVLFTSDDAESVKAYITVTGYWNDETQTEIPVYSYTVTGSFEAGGQKFTVHYTDDSDRATHTATFTANVTNVALESITAEFRQGGNTIYANTSPDDVRSMLTVTAHYNDGTSRVISTGYTVQVNGGAGFAEDGENVITVTYTDNEVTKEATASGSVVVTKKALAGVRAESVQGSGVLYASADWNRVSGYLAVYAVYNDGSETRLSYDASGESGYTLTGNLHESETVTVLFMQYNTQVTLNVIPVEVVSIDEVTVADGATFYTNTSLETVKNYLTVNVTYNDGNSGTLASSEYELTGELTAGVSTLTVSANGQSQTVQVTVTDDAITGIASVSASQGGAVIYSDATAEELKAYLTVTVTLNNGGAKALSAEDYALEFTDGGITGEKYLIRIEGTNFLYEWENTLSITQVEPTELEVTFEQGDLVVLSNTPLRTLADYLTVRVKYNNSEDWTELSYGGADGYTLSGSFGTAEADVQITVKYSYNGAEVTDTITVHVTATSATGIEAELSAEVPVVYATAAHASDAELKALVEGCLTVRLVYNNGAVQNLSAASYTLSVDGEWAAGEVTVKVSYNTFETTFTLNVLEAEVTNIAAEWNETAVYTNDTFDEVKSALTVTAYYNDGTSRDLESGEYALLESEGSLALGGTVTFTVQYSDGGVLRTCDVTVTVTVNLPTAVNAEAKGGVTLYPTSSAEAVKNALTVTVTYTDGSQKEVTNFELGEYTLAAGSVSIPVSYTERGERVETSVQVTVSEVTVGNISVSWKSGSQPTVYTSASLDSLKALITVTGTGTDGSTDMGEIADYTLSVQNGTWGQAGEVTVLVTYAENVTATFTVTLTAYVLATDGVEFDQDFVIYEGYAFDDVKAQIEENLSVVLTWTDGANHYAEHEYGIVSVTGEDGAGRVTVNYTVDGSPKSAEVTLALTEDKIVSFRIEMNGGYALYTSGSANDVTEQSRLVAVHASGNETEESWGAYSAMLQASGWAAGGEVSVTARVYNAAGDMLLGTAQVTVTVTQVRVAEFDVMASARPGQTIWTSDTAEELFAKLSLIVYNIYNNDGSAAAAPSLTAANLSLGGLDGTTRTVHVTYFNGYENVETSFTVEAEEPYVVHVEAASVSGGTVTVIAGSQFDAIKQYFTVTATYSDGETRVLDADEYTISGDISEAGEGKELTFACTLGEGGAEVSDTFAVTAEEAVLESIRATFTQGSAEFYIHEFAQDLAESGLVQLVARFNNGQEISVTLTEEMITLPAGGLKEGQNNTVTVTYAYGDVSKTATVEVYVTAKALESIRAEWTGEETVYTSTQIESLKAHIMVTLVYNDGTTEETQDFEITTTRLTAGTNRIDVQYAPEEGEALTASFGLDVTEVKVSGITAVWTNGEQPEVYDTTDLKTLLTVTAANNDGSPAGTLASTAYRVEGTLTAGQECTVRIVYNADESIYFELSVQVEETLVTEITASYNENVGGYVFTSTSFEEWAQGNGFTVTATYNNGTSRNLSKGEYTLAFTSGTAFTEGTTSVTATYAGEDYVGAAAPSSAFDVTVYGIAVSSAEVTFGGVKVTSGDSLDTLKEQLTAALSAEVSFNNGQQYAFTITAEYSDWQVSDGRWTAKAAWTIRGNGFADYTGESTLEIGGDVTYTITYEGVNESELSGLTTEYTVSDADISLGALSRDGYTFGGWSGTGVSENVFDTATAQDVTIAASWTIVAPEISGLENVTATYTPEGTTLTAGVEETDGLMYAYQWYRGEELLSGQTGISLTLKGVAASGTYKLVVTVSGDDAQSVTAEKEVTVTINKATASAPAAPEVTGELTYGQALSDLTLTENWAWVNGDTVPAVSDSGTTGYGVRIAVDDENYDWSSVVGYTDGYYTATVTVTVNAKEITVAITPNGGTYNDVTGATAALDPESLVGEDNPTVTLTYTSTGGYNSTDVPENAGTYTVTASISDGNYKLTGPVSAEFVIKKASVIRPTEDADADGFVYTGEQRTYMPEGFDEEKMNISGNVQTDANEDGYTVTVSLKDAANYKWATGDASADIEFKFVIRKAAPEYEKPEDLTATYGDTLASVTLPEGWAWESEAGTFVGNAGSNTFTATFTPDDTENYNIVTGVELTVQVAKATPNVTAEVETDGTVYTSDSLYGIGLTANAGGVAGEIAWDEGQTLTAGENSYTWTFTPTDTDNYNTVAGSSTIIVTAVAETSITVTKQPDKTDYTAFETFVSDGMEVTLYYNDGTSKTVSDYTLSIVGQDDMVLRYGADGNVTVTVTYNGHTAEVQVTVKKIVVEVPSAASGLVYNGAAQVGVAENDAYTVTGGSATNAGSYEATVTLKDSENYAWSEAFDGKVTWSIAKADLTLGVTLEGWTYGESANTPVLSGNTAGGEVTYLYTGDGYSSDKAPTDAGKYTLTVTVAETQNYKGGTAECTFTVEKATAEVPEIADKTYTGEHLDSGLADTDLYTVQEDNGGTEQGEYTVTLKLKDAANYKWASGDEDGDGVLTLTYKIAKTQNEWTEEVSIEGWTYGESANAPAFEAKFGGDMAVVEYKPAGAEDSAYTAEVPVNAGSYMVRVTIAETDEYAVLTGTAEFTIAKAKYDMSGVAFADKSVSYSGEAQTMEISGTLPAGVTVTYVYTKGGETVDSAVEAGEYTVTAVFAGDAANYEPIPSMTATLIIEKEEEALTTGEIVGISVGGAACVGLGAAWIVLLRKKRRIGR